MNRRQVISALSGGISVAAAGCISTDPPEATGSEESTRYSDLSEEEQDELLEEHLNEIYNDRVEDGELIHSHNLNITSIEEIADDYVTLETTLSINPVADYTVNLHYNPITVDEHGRWVYKNYVEPVYGSRPPEYDEENHEWVTEEREYANLVQYDHKNASLGEIVSSLTVPSEAFWDEEVSPGENRNRTDAIPLPQDVYGYGWSYVNEFELSKTPEMYEVFVLTLSWEDENTRSPRGGEVVANSAPLIRVGENQYIYPVTHNGNSTVDANWDGRQMFNDHRDYEMEDIYRNDIEEDSDWGVTGNITRLSNYGHFSPKMVNEFDNSSVSVTSQSGPSYLDGDLQHPWSVSYEISRNTRNEANETASSNRTGNSQVDAVSDFLNSPEVMNHDLIQDVASQLGDICEIMDANHPSEQVRVVADFVQYLAHTFEGVSEFGQPSNLFTGTAHPVETLYRGGVGDCKDFTVLGNAILQQDPFNMNPNAIVLPDIFEYVAEGSDDTNSIGHISTAIPVSEMEFDEVTPDDVVSPVSGEYVTVRIRGVEHLYVEMSGPFHIGYIWDEWMRRSTPIPMDEYSNT